MKAITRLIKTSTLIGYTAILLLTSLPVASAQSQSTTTPQLRDMWSIGGDVAITVEDLNALSWWVLTFPGPVNDTLNSTIPEQLRTFIYERYPALDTNGNGRIDDLELGNRWTGALAQLSVMLPYSDANQDGTLDDEDVIFYAREGFGSCPGDIDLNGSIDLFDFAAFRTGFGGGIAEFKEYSDYIYSLIIPAVPGPITIANSPPLFWQSGDIMTDGTVNLIDFALFRAGFGTSCL